MCALSRGAVKDLGPRKSKCWSFWSRCGGESINISTKVHIYMPRLLLFGIRMQQLYANIDFWLGSVGRKEIHLEIIRCASACQIASPRALYASMQRWETSSTAPLFLGADFSVNWEGANGLKVPYSLNGGANSCNRCKKPSSLAFYICLLLFSFPFLALIAVKTLALVYLLKTEATSDSCLAKWRFIIQLYT